MEHSLHLGVGHLLSCIIPVNTRKTHGVRNDENEDDDFDISPDDEYGPVISDALRKLLGLIKQVRRICCHYHIY